MGYEEKLPDGFHDWPKSAQWSWLASGPLTQREMLLFASDELDVALSIEDNGTLTNDDLGQFLGALLNAEVR